jgi:hypothetical protein
MSAERAAKVPFPFLALLGRAREPDVDWAALAEEAERTLPALHAHLETWGATPCSGKRAALRERLVRLLVDCALQRPGQP